MSIVGWFALAVQAGLAVFVVWLNWLVFYRVGEMQMDRARLDKARREMRRAERMVEDLFQRMKIEMRDERLLRLRLENLRISRHGTRIRARAGKQAIKTVRLSPARTVRPDSGCHQSPEIGGGSFGMQRD